MTSALKSIAMTMFILLYYFSTKKVLRIVKYGALAIVSTAFVFIFFTANIISEKIQYYLFLYGGSDGYGEIARTATYLASFQISSDHFPFGSGPGTFGSYPVLISYNDIYHKYGLSNVWGLSEENLLDPDLPVFLLDTYWSSPLGELGVIGLLSVLFLHFYPILKIKKMRKFKELKNNEYLKSIRFYIFSVGLVLFFENLTLSSLNQVSIILIYFGFSGLLIASFLQDLKIKRL
jgi:hypothetical protein